MSINSSFQYSSNLFTLRFSRLRLAFSHQLSAKNSAILNSSLCPLSSVLCPLPSVFRPPSSALCRLLSVLCHPSSALCSQADFSSLTVTSNRIGIQFWIERVRWQYSFISSKHRFPVLRSPSSTTICPQTVMPLMKYPVSWNSKVVFP